MRRIVLPIICALFGIAIIMCLKNCNNHENFGTSPGTMTQLQTSHVPTEEDAHFYKNVYPGMVRKEVIGLTGGDPGELRPWIFPWYGRGVTLVAT
jgi:hypothetical protein